MTPCFTAVFVFSGSGGNFTGHETFTSGAGGLDGLRGGGTFTGSPLGNTYSFRYQFAP